MNECVSVSVCGPGSQSLLWAFHYCFGQQVSKRPFRSNCAWSSELASPGSYAKQNTRCAVQSLSLRAILLLFNVKQRHFFSCCWFMVKEILQGVVLLSEVSFLLEKKNKESGENCLSLTLTSEVSWGWTCSLTAILSACSETRSWLVHLSSSGP